MVPPGTAFPLRLGATAAGTLFIDSLHDEFDDGEVS
jgi:hypothetical protein